MEKYISINQILLDTAPVEEKKIVNLSLSIDGLSINGKRRLWQHICLKVYVIHGELSVWVNGNTRIGQQGSSSAKTTPLGSFTYCIFHPTNILIVSVFLSMYRNCENYTWTLYKLTYAVHPTSTSQSPLIVYPRWMHRP